MEGSTEKQQVPGPQTGVLEKHFTIIELAEAWHLSPQTVRRWFKGVKGVIRYGPEKLKKGHERTYVSLRVPESVAMKVKARYTRQD